MADHKQMIAEVRAELDRVEKSLQQIKENFTDTAHLNIARIHVRELANQLETRFIKPAAEPEAPAPAHAGAIGAQPLADEETEEVEVSGVPVTHMAAGAKTTRPRAKKA